MCVRNGNVVTNTSGLSPSLPPKLLWAASLLAAALQAVHNTAQPDVQQPNLSIQVIDFLLQGAGPASSAPVRPHRSRHEVHGHDEAQRQHRALGITLKLL